MRWVFTIKKVDVTMIKPWQLGFNWDLTMKTGANTIEKVDLLWAMRIFHAFTMQKFDVIFQNGDSTINIYKFLRRIPPGI